MDGERYPMKRFFVSLTRVLPRHRALLLDLPEEEKLKVPLIDMDPQDPPPDHIVEAVVRVVSGTRSLLNHDHWWVSETGTTSLDGDLFKLSETDHPQERADKILTKIYEGFARGENLRTNLENMTPTEYKPNYSMRNCPSIFETKTLQPLVQPFFPDHDHMCFEFLNAYELDSQSHAIQEWYKLENEYEEKKEKKEEQKRQEEETRLANEKYARSIFQIKWEEILLKGIGDNKIERLRLEKKMMPEKDQRNYVRSVVFKKALEEIPLSSYKKITGQQIVEEYNIDDPFGDMPNAVEFWTEPAEELSKEEFEIYSEILSVVDMLNGDFHFDGTWSVIPKFHKASIGEDYPTYSRVGFLLKWSFGPGPMFVLSKEFSAKKS